MSKSDPKIVIKDRREHSKASERYVDVMFSYDDKKLELSIPIEYRRTGVGLTDDAEIEEYLDLVYDLCNPQNWGTWRKEQEEFWRDKCADITEEIFKALLDFKWTCVRCGLPQNPNWARRVQDLKECDYTIATKTHVSCNKCGGRTTNLLLLPIPRGGVSGYEAWSPELRERIVRVLECYDVYEGKKVPNYSLLPDHKFPEIRWDANTRRDTLEHLSAEMIKEEFQLMSNQRNQQKREVCRYCYQNGKRGCPYGIKFYYSGSENWPDDIPKRGKIAEKGCIGCGWYDLGKWRQSLNHLLTKKL